MKSRAPRGTAVLVFCSALALYTLTAGGSLTSTDAVVTFDLTASLVERHSIALTENGTFVMRIASATFSCATAKPTRRPAKP